MSTVLAGMCLDADQTLESSQVILGFEIGGGSFTRVCACEVRRSEGADVDAVAKIIHQPTQENMADLVNECILWSRLEHPNIARFLGACAAGSDIWLILERFHGGSLDKHLRHKLQTAAEPLSASCVLRVMNQVSSAAPLLSSRRTHGGTYAQEAECIARDRPV